MVTLQDGSHSYSGDTAQHEWLVSLMLVDQSIRWHVRDNTVQVHTITAYRKRGGTDPLILHVCTRFSWVVSLNSRPICTQRKNVPHLLNKTSGGTQGAPGVLGKMKIFCPYRESNPGSMGTTPTALSQHLAPSVTITRGSHHVRLQFGAIPTRDAQS